MGRGPGAASSPTRRRRGMAERREAGIGRNIYRYRRRRKRALLVVRPLRRAGAPRHGARRKRIEIGVNVNAVAPGFFLSSGNSGRFDEGASTRLVG